MPRRWWECKWVVRAVHAGTFSLHITGKLTFVCQTILICRVVWSVLVVELLFEFLIRPNNYHELVLSDKAFAPTSARHINRYHLICEFLALLLYIPSVSCTISKSCSSINCLTEASLWAITSLSRWKAATGRFFLGLTFLRAFGLVRHWKQMWIDHTFDKKDGQQSSIVRRLLLVESHKTTLRRLMMRRRKKTDEENDSTNGEDDDLEQMRIESKIDTEEDKQLKSAANIGTALMLVNSHRALFLMLFIVACVPAIFASHQRNPVSYNEVQLLQANNVASNTTDLCDYLENAVQAWFKSTTLPRENFRGSEAGLYVKWVQLLPVRCDWQDANGVIQYCEEGTGESQIVTNYCDALLDAALSASPEDAEPEYFAEELGLRFWGVHEISVQDTGPADFQNGMSTAAFSVRAIFNESDAIANT